MRILSTLLFTFIVSSASAQLKESILSSVFKTGIPRSVNEVKRVHHFNWKLPLFKPRYFADLKLPVVNLDSIKMRKGGFINIYKPVELPGDTLARTTSPDLFKNFDR